MEVKHLVPYKSNLSQCLKFGAQQVSRFLDSSVVDAKGDEREGAPHVVHEQCILDETEPLLASLPNLLDAQRHETRLLQLLLLEARMLVAFHVDQNDLAQFYQLADPLSERLSPAMIHVLGQDSRTALAEVLPVARSLQDFLSLLVFVVLHFLLDELQIQLVLPRQNGLLECQLHVFDEVYLARQFDVLLHMMHLVFGVVVFNVLLGKAELFEQAWANHPVFVMLILLPLDMHKRLDKLLALGSTGSLRWHLTQLHLFTAQLFEHQRLVRLLIQCVQLLIAN